VGRPIACHGLNDTGRALRLTLVDLHPRAFQDSRTMPLVMMVLEKICEEANLCGFAARFCVEKNCKSAEMAAASGYENICIRGHPCAGAILERSRRSSQCEGLFIVVCYVVGRGSKSVFTVDLTRIRISHTDSHLQAPLVIDLVALDDHSL